MDIKEEILAQMDSALRPEFDKAINNTIEGAFKEDVKTLGFMVANSIKCQWEVMKPHLFYAYCLGVKAQEAKAQAVPEWIETAIQPPEEGQKVIISGIYGVGIAEFSYLYKDEFVMYDMGASNPILSKDQVKFWMPLPDAPQEPAND